MDESGLWERGRNDGGETEGTGWAGTDTHTHTIHRRDWPGGDGHTHTPSSSSLSLVCPAGEGSWLLGLSVPAPPPAPRKKPGSRTAGRPHSVFQIPGSFNYNQFATLSKSLLPSTNTHELDPASKSPSQPLG